MRVDKYKRSSLNLPVRDWDAIDHIAKEYGMTRGEAFHEAVVVLIKFHDGVLDQNNILINRMNEIVAELNDVKTGVQNGNAMSHRLLRINNGPSGLGHDE